MSDYYEYGRGPGKRGGFWKYFTIVVVTVLLTVTVTVLLASSIRDYFSPKNGASVTDVLTPTSTPVSTEGSKPAQTPAVTEQQPTATSEIGGQKVQNSNTGDVIVDVAANVGPCVVGVISYQDNSKKTTEETTYYGSGIVIRSDGYIVTNNHMISGMNKVYVLLNGQDEKIPATVIGADKAYDLAVIKIDRVNMQAAMLGDSSKVKVGQMAVAIGNPIGLNFFGTVTSGIISGINRKVTISGSTMNFLQTDASINFGNSGGALINADGEVIGINTAKSIYAGYDDDGNAVAAEGIGLAIPINDAKPVIQQLMVNRTIPRPYIGISIYYIDEETAKENNLVSGIYIQSVSEKSPSEAAGLKADDIIVSLNGIQYKNTEDFTNEVKKHLPGDKLEMIIYRQGKKLNITVIVGDMNGSD